MRTKTQDSIDRRKLLEREKNLLFPHIHQAISIVLGYDNPFDIEDVSRDRSFRLACNLDVDVEWLSGELGKLFGAVVTSSVQTRGDGCCEECYTEYDRNILEVSSISKNWPALELALLAPKKRKTT